MRTRYSVVDVKTRLRDRRSGIQIRVGLKYFVLLENAQTSFVVNLPPIKQVPRAFPWGLSTSYTPLPEMSLPVRILFQYYKALCLG